MDFGQYIKKLRLDQNKSLRGFCEEHGLDPGNHSKLERGILKPSQDEALLRKLALALNIKEKSEAWNTFMDLATVGSGKIPDYIMENEKVLDKLPMFFRTVNGDKISREKLEQLIELIKSS